MSAGSHICMSRKRLCTLSKPAKTSVNPNLFITGSIKTPKKSNNICCSSRVAKPPILIKITDHKYRHKMWQKSKLIVGQRREHDFYI